ncbi:MAG: UDP-N-acetylglucosamine--N-acetylmuramyl-(pentapeptide) pyrophosphoryl-undecaprenol N-acetylglucosamine transferase [Rhabdochlamydiaceae bacterium]|nr:UDP-N-acetylglucosamine--N-acetylmuramyl-(pentapeptide) pyrophosphoryl-undecaprenol N-acetylglucosamine transferase [Candidatus Amphrikana amoebophyrae]
MPKLVFAVGGTGGHIIPAKILRKELKQYEITFAGIGLKPIEGVQTVTLTGANFSLKKPFSSLLKMAKGVYQSIKLLKKEKPKAVIGFGSYHSFPPLLAAYILRIPYILYEPNRKAGRVNRLFASKALFTALLFESIQDELKCPFKTIAPLIPIEKHEKGRARIELGLDEDKLTLLVFGGSQGAQSINEAMMRLAKELPSSLQVYHVCGSQNDPSSILETYLDCNVKAVVVAYEKRMDLCWSAADFAICRSGANSVMEQIEYSCPAIFIPYPHDRDGHQKANAHYAKTKVGGSLIIEAERLTIKEVLSLIESKETMQRNMDEYKLSRKAENFHTLIMGI